MKKALPVLLAIFLLLHNIANISAQNYGTTITLTLNPRVHTLDENRNGNFVWTQLKDKVKYEVTVSGDVFYGNQKAKGFFVYFTNNKEDGFAERYLFIKSGDKFYINAEGARPFFLAFMVKFYSNRASYRGNYIITIKPIGPSQPGPSYNEDDMYRGIR